jgi:hypothetical protein
MGDPVMLTESQSASVAFQTFCTILLGLPLAAYGAYTIMTQFLKEDDTLRRRRPLRVNRESPAAADGSDALPFDTDEQSGSPSTISPAVLEQSLDTILVGTTCVYGNVDDVLENVTVIAIHAEEIPVYYTVRFANGTERQTTRDMLLAPGDPIVQEEEEVEKVAPVHPEIAYAQSIKLTEHRPLADSSPQSAFVIESTPAGLIAMGYDFTEKRWIYWANSTPHFRVLDTVARVYSNTHNRHPLYIPPSVADAANEVTDKEDDSAENTAKKIAEDKKASLFITPTPTGSADIPRPEQKHIANSFKRKGMLSELRFLDDGPRNPPKHLSYEEFLAKRE